MVDADTSYLSAKTNETFTVAMVFVDNPLYAAPRLLALVILATGGVFLEVFAEEFASTCPDPQIPLTPTLVSEMEDEQLGCRITVEGFAFGEHSLRFFGGHILNILQITDDQAGSPPLIAMNVPTELDVEAGDLIRVIGVISKAQNSQTDYLVFVDLEDYERVQDFAAAVDRAEANGDTYQGIVNWLESFFEMPTSQQMVPVQTIDPVGRLVSFISLGMSLVAIIGSTIGFFLNARALRLIRFEYIEAKVFLHIKDNNIKIQQEDNMTRIFLVMTLFNTGVRPFLIQSFEMIYFDGMRLKIEEVHLADRNLLPQARAPHANEYKLKFCEPIFLERKLEVNMHLSVKKEIKINDRKRFHMRVCEFSRRKVMTLSSDIKPGEMSYVTKDNWNKSVV